MQVIFRENKKEITEMKEKEEFFKSIELKRFKEIKINTNYLKDKIGHLIVFEPNVILLLNPTLKQDKNRDDRINIYDIETIELL